MGGVTQISFGCDRDRTSRKLGLETDELLELELSKHTRFSL